MIATPASGGRGRTWDSADLVIYYTNSFNYEHRAQSEERAQAVGKKTSVLYYDLVCLDTVEEKVLGALRNKMSLSDAITGDDYKKWVV
jgi:SNF2 family DNA or RNA helicase